MDTNELQRLILNLVRKGTIAEVDHASAKCRVATGDLTTNWISWMALAAGQTRDWNPPTVGEQVLLSALVAIPRKAWSCAASTPRTRRHRATRPPSTRAPIRTAR